MCEKIVSMVAETKPIAALIGGTVNEVYWRCSRYPRNQAPNCERIVPYFESDGGGFTAWFVVYVNGEVVARVSSKTLDEVLYVADPPEANPR